MIPPIGTLTLPAAPEGRTLDAEAGTAETDALDADVDDEDRKAETEAEDAEDVDDTAGAEAEAEAALNDDLALDAAPDAQAAVPPISISVTVLLPVAAF